MKIIQTSIEDKSSKTRKLFNSGFLTIGNFRDILLVLLLGLVIYKFAVAQISLNFKDFQFSDFLSMVMAFFAIGLSVAFYFKATETSNRFYDNTYKFTQDTSKILGRIESGFGERLKHIDENYSDISTKFDMLRTKQAGYEEEVRKGEESTSKTSSEINEIIEAYSKKAQINDTEKVEFKNLLAKKEDELLFSATELNKYKTELNKLKKIRAERETEQQIKNIHSQLSAFDKARLITFIEKNIGFDVIMSASPNYLKNEIQIIEKRWPFIWAVLSKLNLIDNDGRLTRIGIQFLMYIAQEENTINF